MNNAQWRAAAAATTSATDSSSAPSHHVPAHSHSQQVFKAEPDVSHGSASVSANVNVAVAGQRHKQSSSSPVGSGAGAQSHSRPILQSCQFCRKRKIKCDKLEGGCTQCARAKTECIYPVSQRKGRPRKAGNKHSMPAATPREQQLLKKIWKLETVIDSLTGRGGQGAMSSLDQNPEHPLREQLDRLVVGKSYVSDTFWADDSVEQVPEDSDEDFSEDDAEEGQFPLAQSSMPEAYHSNFIFGVDLPDEDLTPLHPPLEQIPLYWEIYVENCETVLAVFHKPTTLKIVQQAHRNIRSLSKANELLMFSIYFATINSLSTDDVYHKFNADKGLLLTHYENAIQRALVRVGFLNTQDLAVLQAFVLYLICIRHTDGAIVWSLTGLAIRISQGMNVDRDGELFNLSPLQTEIRRRIWHQISILDVRASEAKGCFPTPLFYDTKIPTNINDDDISVETREYPKHKDEITEMTIAILRYETCEIGRRLRRPGLTQEAKEKMIKDFHADIDRKYLQHCREKGGVYTLSNSIASVVTSRMFLMLYKRQSEELDEKPGTRDQLFQTATELLEYSYDILRHPDGSKWNWLFKAFASLPIVQWHAINIVLNEILFRCPSPTTDRAWRIIDASYQDWEIPPDRANKVLYYSVQKLLAQAQECRAAQQRAQHTLHQQQYINAEAQQAQSHSQTRTQAHSIHSQSHAPLPQQSSTLGFTPNVFTGAYSDGPDQGSTTSHLTTGPPDFYVPQQTLNHGEIYVNQGTGLLDDTIGVGIGVNVAQEPVAQQPWFVPIPPPHETQTHPLSLEGQNIVYGPDETWHAYNNLLKNYSMHGGLG